MIKRILVALDTDADTPVAINTAMDIARRHDAELSGLALIDVEAIDTETAGGGIGSMYYAEKMRRSLTDEVRTRAQTLLGSFVETVEQAGIRHSGDHVGQDGVVRNLVDDMRTHDLLITGRESHFYYADEGEASDTILKIIESGAAATLVVGETPVAVERVLVAYDGSSAAARTLQKFVHLSPFGRDVRVEIVHVHREGAEARLMSERLLQDAKVYVDAHGYTNTLVTSLEGDAVSERILAHAATQEADLIVSGAYAKTGLKRFFLGSSAPRLVSDATVPLFLYR
jgi:nucleotide-binding universal stress UspA family protein